jgi:hypothetical protein
MTVVCFRILIVLFWLNALSATIESKPYGSADEEPVPMRPTKIVEAIGN